MRAIFAIPLLLAAIGLSSCEDRNAARRSALEQQVQQANQTLTVLDNDILVRQSRIDGLTKELSDENNALSQNKADVDAYLLDHKMVTIAIAAGVAGANASLDPDNEYSQDAHAIGGIMVAAAALYALAHAQEVTEVVSYLEQADIKAKQIKQSMDSTSQTLNGEQAALVADRQNASRQQGLIADLNGQIGKLQPKYWWSS
ncbi:MAG TPA: hypothetical protein VMH86_14345 [Rhizomicrobium sp.]|nr:hypothetical protein [Rhizomicrobium sp.]